MIDSIKTRIVLGVNLVILLVLVIASVVDYYRSLHEIDEVFDAQLAQTSRLLARLVENDPGLPDRLSPLIVAVPQLEQQLMEVPSALERLREGHKYESQIGFQVRSRDGRLLLSSANTSHTLLAPLQSGYFERSDPDHQWISFSLFDEASQLWLQAGQHVAVRDELSWYLVSGQIGQVLVTMLLLSVLIYLLVQHMFAPVDALSQQLQQSSPTALQPLDIALPTEIAPVQRAINTLLDNISQHLAQEKRFIADASHELRTPLAILRLHAQNISQANNDADRKKALDAIISSSMRMSHLVSQLMALARVDRQQLTHFSPVQLLQLTEETLAQLPSAQLDKVDWQLEIDPALYVRGDPSLLQVVWRNLLDNASKYAPADSCVQVRASRSQQQITCVFENYSHLVLQPDKQRLTDRFYRSPGHQQIDGAGLGLSIVKQIISLHQASMQISQLEDMVAVTLHFDSA
ncbi:MAG: two-component sensor histidine kinase [Rheinheimera sp.]|nr:MAG: two-component sensor histidine kinase [Rheinheimera sp.]